MTTAAVLYVTFVCFLSSLLSFSTDCLFLPPTDDDDVSRQAVIKKARVTCKINFFLFVYNVRIILLHNVYVSYFSGKCHGVSGSCKISPISFPLLSCLALFRNL